jgi:pimeloyl-ACP methyl ester carboxylesterase
VAVSSPFAIYASIDTWLTDVRADLPKLDVPVLVMHGTDDGLLPFELPAARLPALIARHCLGFKTDGLPWCPSQPLPLAYMPLP